MSARKRLKNLVEDVLGSAPVASLARRRLRDRTLILAYHNIVADGEPPIGDHSLHIPVSQFASQLDRIQSHFDVVPITAALTPSQQRPRVVITFDDAYRGTVRLGLPELMRRNLPSTIFVTPGMLGGRSFWWDSFSDPISGLAPAVRSHALRSLQGKDALVRAWAARHSIAQLAIPPDAQTASEDELRAGVASGGVLLGSHTWSHPALPTLDAAELRAELERPLAWLRNRFAGATPWLTYPYGLASADVAFAAREAGYVGACRVTGGWARPSTADPFDLPRQAVPNGLSTSGFSLRLTGIVTD